MIADSFSSFHEKDEKKNNELHGLCIFYNIPESLVDTVGDSINNTYYCKILRWLLQVKRQKVFSRKCSLVESVDDRKNQI
jgi:hypothetical protein